MQRYYSNIYWHFTGSPNNIDWHKVGRPMDILTLGGKPKTDNDSIDILGKILETEKLLANCDEKVSENIVTDKFCCVTDIPLKDLLSHKKYYGNVAIGFKPMAIQKKFLPVMYIPSDNLPVVEFIIRNPVAEQKGYEFLSYQGSWAEQQGMRLLAQSQAKVKKVDSNQIQGFLMNYIKITNFNINEADSFYREREWRHIGNFHFKNEDIAAIVVPSHYIAETREIISKFDYPSDISIISWDIIELS